MTSCGRTRAGSHRQYTPPSRASAPSRPAGSRPLSPMNQGRRASRARPALGVKRVRSRWASLFPRRPRPSASLVPEHLPSRSEQEADRPLLPRRSGSHRTPPCSSVLELPLRASGRFGRTEGCRRAPRHRTKPRRAGRTTGGPPRARGRDDRKPVAARAALGRAETEWVERRERPRELDLRREPRAERTAPKADRAEGTSRPRPRRRVKPGRARVTVVRTTAPDEAGGLLDRRR